MLAFNGMELKKDWLLLIGREGHHEEDVFDETVLLAMVTAERRTTTHQCRRIRYTNSDEYVSISLRTCSILL